MRTQPPSKSTGWFTGRTRLITVVSIVAVAFAGAAAVSANIGILDSVSDGPVGNASVTGDFEAPSNQVRDVSLPVSELPSSDPTVQKFAVDDSGIVSVAATETGIRVNDVNPSAGWKWTLWQDSPTGLLVTMTNGTRTVEFTATRTAGGRISASVQEPVVTDAAGRRDDHDDDHDDDDKHDRDDKHDKDDHDKYEGGEDDD